MSMGVNLLSALVQRVAKTLEEDFDIEILEMHHNKKVDAPSGTALMLGRAAAAGRGIDLAQHSVRGRKGTTAARVAGARGFSALRALPPLPPLRGFLDSGPSSHSRGRAQRMASSTVHG